VRKSHATIMSLGIHCAFATSLLIQQFAPEAPAVEIRFNPIEIWESIAHSGWKKGAPKSVCGLKRN
jgi:hypothetical protein